MTNAQVPFPFDDTFNAKVDSNGLAVITFGPTDSYFNWSVSQVSIEMLTAPVGATCVMRKGGAFVTFLIATGDVAGGDPPLFLRPGDRVTITWEGCTPDDYGKAYVIYDKIGFS